MLFLPFSNSLLIICGINQRPVSKSMFAILITILSPTCFHYRCAASLILASTVPGVTRITIVIGQKRVRPFNALVLLVFERPLVTGGRSTWSFRNAPRQANLVLIAYASSEGSGEPAHPRSFARTYAARSYKQ